ncbi:lysophospholipid acyltransferase family protein [Agromyces archimandritae]|uniref:1-acyl-sn-glycerol-3-phosphate acyltransferase n=1 Tax=Agromyces archimandritae TaxID=2781962 RepID=A0A975FME9_9MICO|nr:lysophospholipid acyltransferase family protein [Agromyces archimandritae]QTX05130.1 1-acyl-sn-glycerol-3-phosphate acyltransferase [Agromyces archimandritae]
MRAGACWRAYPRTVTDAPPEAPPVPRQGAAYGLIAGVLRPLARLIYRPTITGVENVPKDGPVIFASNHLSFVDSIVIPLTSPRPVRFLAKSHYFTGTGVKGWITRTFFEAIGAVSVERGAGAAAQDALDQSKRIIDTGNAFALYPEGTRSLDGRLYKGRTGVAWLALETGAPVVPVGLVGTQEIQPVGAKLPRVRPVAVHFGEPLDLSGHGPSTSGRARRAATDEVMAAIHARSGQELAGRYNESPPANPIAKLADRVLPRERR